MLPGEPLRPAYKSSSRANGLVDSADPFRAPWSPHDRFAPPGPARASFTAPATILVLAPPAFRLLPHVPDLPALELDETGAPEPAVEPADAQPSPDTELPSEAHGHAGATDRSTERPGEPGPATAVEDAAGAATSGDGSTRPDPDAVDLPADTGQTAPPALPATASSAAYWATTGARTAGGAESLDWAPPAGAKLKPTAPSPFGLWNAEPVDMGQEVGPSLPGWPSRLGGRRIARTAAALGVLAAACVLGVLLLPRFLAQSGMPAATFNAPMMVLRAAVAGRVTSVDVKTGQAVEPSTQLLTIRTEPTPDPGATLLQDRLEAAKGRLASLDDALTQPTPSTDAGRTRLADLRRQRALTAADVAQLQDGVAAIPPGKPVDQPVRAGTHGVVRSLEAQAGTATATGLPLIRMLDCDHAFLTIGPTTMLHAGQAVQVKLPNLPPVLATVRNSAGIAEPPDSLVIAATPGAFTGILSGSCPIGATATVTPGTTGS